MTTAETWPLPRWSPVPASSCRSGPRAPQVRPAAWACKRPCITSIPTSSCLCRRAGLRDIPYPSAMDHFRSIRSPLNKYLALRDLLNVSPQSYYSLLYEHAEEILPFIYTVSNSSCPAAGVDHHPGPSPADAAAAPQHHTNPCAAAGMCSCSPGHTPCCLSSRT